MLLLIGSLELIDQTRLALALTPASMLLIISVVSWVVVCLVNRLLVVPSKSVRADVAWHLLVRLMPAQRILQKSELFGSWLKIVAIVRSVA